MTKKFIFHTVVPAFTMIVNDSLMWKRSYPKTLASVSATELLGPPQRHACELLHFSMAWAENGMNDLCGMVNVRWCTIPTFTNRKK